MADSEREIDDLEDDGDPEDEDDIVILIDAEGNEEEYEFLAILEVDGEDYALLTPVNADENEPVEVFIYAYGEDEDGEETFSDVPNEATFAKVRAQAEGLFAEAEDDEDYPFC